MSIIPIGRIAADRAVSNHRPGSNGRLSAQPFNWGPWTTIAWITMTSMAMTTVDHTGHTGMKARFNRSSRLSRSSETRRGHFGSGRLRS
jgi:hypothetical protein